MPVVGDIESRLALIPVTNTRQRKRRRSNGEVEEEDESDVSVGSLNLRGPSQVGNGTNRAGMDPEAEPSRPNRRMPILDVDFPVGSSERAAPNFGPAPIESGYGVTFPVETSTTTSTLQFGQNGAPIQPIGTGVSWFGTGETPGFQVSLSSRR